MQLVLDFRRAIKHAFAMPASGDSVKYNLESMDPAAMAWVLASAALGLIMVPGIAFFYGGMVRAMNVLSMLMQNFVVMALASVLWVLVTFSLAFGEGNAFVGDLHFAGLSNLDEVVPGFTDERALVVLPIVFALFQMMFAAVTPALITGAAADRWRFAAFVPFVVCWSILVYAPIAHWVFSPLGWISRLGALDFAGGLVVHVSAGAAGLALAVVMGRRQGWPEEPMPPHNLPLVLLGAALLWFGWFGFNSGSALAANGLAAQAFINTNTACAVGLLSWISVERLRYGKTTTLGAASGAVAGLVSVTPGAGYITTSEAIVVGVLAGVCCSFAVSAKEWLRLDDSLDVVGVHLIGGFIGSLAVGLFASEAVNPLGGTGLFHGGGYRLLSLQALAGVVVAAYSFVATYLIAKLIDRIVGLRVSPGEELQGMDLALHGEMAYNLQGRRRPERRRPAPTGS
ncbi:ammonium transporter [Streptomyces sp. PSKA30]|uniref:ammonium transporter n=1 Tax=Streptomyces sp. PSKA30 TaxID=2874597 RepID=UPI001CD15928|nr:ammonium transporter [Streptomyces sp. PSKA30]MBZ9645428.1 ammonium transporter [Streptomyces sp. PSKA30]